MLDTTNVVDSIEVIDLEPQGPCTALFPPVDTIITSHSSWTKTNFSSRIGMFQQDTIDEGDIVMLGNSLTEQGGNWSNKLGVSDAKNRGISGDNTDGVLARLNELICRNPSTVFLMIGTNDLWTSYTAEKIAAQIHLIGTTLKQELPDTHVVIQTIMPAAHGNDKKAKLLAINDLLRGFDERIYSLEDTHLHMSNEEGDLPQAYTTDGVHLNEAGYTKWASFLKEIIAAHN
ncbi:MAG: hypothetical protein JXR10_17705 [Cyclobacteriaceae bacterium]